jgi:hypothetical protein
VFITSIGTWWSNLDFSVLELPPLFAVTSPTPVRRQSHRSVPISDDDGLSETLFLVSGKSTEKIQKQQKRAAYNNIRGSAARRRNAFKYDPRECRRKCATVQGRGNAAGTGVRDICFSENGCTASARSYFRSEIQYHQLLIKTDSDGNETRALECPLRTYLCVCVCVCVCVYIFSREWYYIDVHTYTYAQLM